MLRGKRYLVSSRMFRKVYSAYMEHLILCDTGQCSICEVLSKVYYEIFYCLNHD